VIVRQLLDAVPSGSYLVISHPITEVDAEPMIQAVQSWNQQGSAQMTLRTREEIVRFFDGPIWSSREGFMFALATRADRRWRDRRSDPLLRRRAAERGELSHRPARCCSRPSSRRPRPNSNS
jgi:S-adenosyl methyltransferase